MSSDKLCFAILIAAIPHGSSFELGLVRSDFGRYVRNAVLYYLPSSVVMMIVDLEEEQSCLTTTKLSQ